MPRTITENNMLAIMHTKSQMDFPRDRRWGTYYVALRRLVREGLVQVETLERQGIDRYTMTQKGREEYAKLAKSSSGLDSRSRMKGVKPSSGR